MTTEESSAVATTLDSSRPEGRCSLFAEDERASEIALRGELLVGDRFGEHAAELGHAFAGASLAVPEGALRARFVAARKKLREACEAIAKNARSVRDPSPAAEWLLDNQHVVEEQLREIEEDLPDGYLAELPRIVHGQLASYPRVHGLCLDYLRHTDARIDLDALVCYVGAFQRSGPLSIGELWAVPIMLRVGLVLWVSALAASEADHGDATRAKRWSERIGAAAEDGQKLARVLQALDVEEGAASPAFLVRLERGLRELEDAPNAAFAWIRGRCGAMGVSPLDLARAEHLRQAADQVSVGNAITSMRCIAALDWNEFFERTSVVEAALRRDPAEAYAATDAPTRDRYRHAIEDVAHRSPLGESQVAEAAIRLAAAARVADPSDLGKGHVGYWLIDGGRAELERTVGYRPRLGRRIRRAARRAGPDLYFAAVFTTTALFAAGAALFASRLGAHVGVCVAVLALAAVVGSELASTWVNTLVTLLVPPRRLPKFAFREGIPAEHTTLVVVPSLLSSPSTVQKLLADLEVRALANPDENLHFGLVTDFTDHGSADHPEDEALLRQALAGIEELNRKYGVAGEQRYVLFHRRRRENSVEGCFMGWERKRGKLEELNHLLCGTGETDFTVVTAPPGLLERIRYVITLDADTDLPRDTGRKLVAAMAHPLNRPVLDDAGAAVVRGYGVIQPRLGTQPTSARRSLYAKITSGQAGIDPYTTAASDVYQDIFEEGSYVGKGIYDVAAFSRALAGRVPDNRLLSHDLFEGLFARTALASDIELLDEQPASYAVAVPRRHRWTRGDWQLLPWLLPRVPHRTDPKRRNDVPPLGRFKLLDNLRRSLVLPALVVWLLLGWATSPAVAVLAAGSLFLVVFAPLLARMASVLVRRSKDGAEPFSRAPLGELALSAAESVLGAVLVFDRAVVLVHAIGCTVYRLVVSKKGLLEWEATGESERRRAQAGHGVDKAMVWRTASGVALGIGATLVGETTWPFAAPLVFAWALSPWLMAWLGKPTPARDHAAPLSRDEKAFFHALARKTWSFFEHFVTEGENFLPPDNFQEVPRGVVAHRTSPSNIGLYLLSTVSARDLGFITLFEMTRRLRATLSTIERMEKREGHLLNWYETTTLRPLDPRYVSTVDSGNFAACLITLAEACDEFRAADLGTEGEAHGHAVLVEEREALMGFLPRLEGAPEIVTDAAAGPPWKRLVDDVACATCIAALASATRVARGRAAELEMLVSETKGYTDAAKESGATFLAALGAALERAADRAEELDDALVAVAERARAISDAMRFGFLFDKKRELFSIGYNVGSARLDGSHYDLLASEARLASLVAIARGEAPKEHWFRLARPRAALPSGRVLLSWSGTMFEYLMPLLVTKGPAGTLLAETYASAVAWQREYAEERGVPWGISECAYNTMDLGMTYQYRAFGAPGLGLKAGLGEDLVVAPYATALAAMVRPDLAMENFRTLEREGLGGLYGYYEAIDYTPEHVPPGRRSVVVKTFMAHHQGMTLVALANVLTDARMQRRFHRDPRIKATELLLEERIPRGAPLVERRSTPSPTPPAVDAEMRRVEHVAFTPGGAERAHLVGHGDLSALVSASGIGRTTWKGLDVHRFREDALLDPTGVFVYVRDLGTRRFSSATFEPTRTKPDHYDVAFLADRVEIARRDGDLEVVSEIGVSPEHPALVRRMTLTNHGDEARTIELTTYTEIVLGSHEADVAHRAFSNLFVETEALVERGALLARRRPRGAEEAETWVAQVFAPESGVWEGAEFETSRTRFIGRGRDVRAPAALVQAGELSGAVGFVLDPALALRRRVRLGPGEQARIVFSTVLASSRAAVLDLVNTFAAEHGVLRAFELGVAATRVELEHLGITAAEAHRFQRLLSALLFPSAKLRAELDATSLHGRGRDALFAQGLSGDLPILLLRVDDPEFIAVGRELLIAHEFFRQNGVAIDLVFLDEEPAGYLHPVEDRIRDLVRSGPTPAKENQRGGVFVRRTDAMSPEVRTMLLYAARVVLATSRGSLARQLKARAVEERPEASPALRPAELRPQPKVEGEWPKLAFDNGIGGFDAEGRDYVMRIAAGARPPMPWCNVMANASFGCIVSESGATCTWAGNSQTHRLSPWHNDPLSDPSSETIYVRDEEDGAVWSATPSPAGGAVVYEVRHTQGATSFAHNRRGVFQELEVFVSASDPVKVFRLRLANRGDRPRSFSVFGVVEWVLGTSREKTRLGLVTEALPDGRAIFARNPFDGSPERCAFLASSQAVSGFTADREEFFGTAGSRERPRGTSGVALSKRVGAGLDPCAALAVRVRVAPSETVELAFVLGEGASAVEARELVERHANVERVGASFVEAKAAWDQILGRITVRTPDPALDVLVNRWLVYQVLSARFWGRSAAYQSSGAFGFRDQLQDVLALLHSRPDIARRHLLLAASRQFLEGDVQHWWHADTGEGVRTRCSDDMLWLPYAVAEYVRATGDHAVLDEPVAFLEQRPLKPEEVDVFAAPPPSAQTATLYEHCARALDAGTTAGALGLPLIGAGDWNDGMNRVGAKGQGESVWLAFFLARTLADFAPLAARRGDKARVERCAETRARLALAVHEHGWDGGWYRRATFDDGTWLGSKESPECKIDAIVQSWAAIAGIDGEARASRALASADELLLHDRDGMMRLFWPAFAGAGKDAGYIGAYPAGVRENGGQYTHGVLWTALARAQVGDGAAAHALLALLNPIRHGATPEGVARYAVEPYVVAADVYAAFGHVGRGGWTWYTGSAGWMYRIAVEHILGIRLEGGRLVVAPSIPPSFKGYEVTYRVGRTTYEIVVENPLGLSKAMCRLELDGKPCESGVLLADDGRRHRVRAQMVRESGAVPLRLVPASVPRTG